MYFDQLARNKKEHFFGSLISYFFELGLLFEIVLSTLIFHKVNWDIAVSVESVVFSLEHFLIAGHN